MATAQDAELILKLYELRTETTMRKAREFMTNGFNPEKFAEILALQRALGSEQNGYWRQVIGYWEMAAAFVLRGALDPELFLDCVGEPFFLYAKFTPFQEEYAAQFGFPMMEKVGTLIKMYPAMQERYTMLLAMMEARRKQNAG